MIAVRKLLTFFYKFGLLGICDLGENLKHQVDAFVGLAGANYGLCSICVGQLEAYPVCNKLVSAKSCDLDSETVFRKKTLHYEKFWFTDTQNYVFSEFSV